MEKIALIGPAYHEYQSSVREVIKNEGKCWSLWTYCHNRQEKIRKLREQINDKEIGYFNIYVYNTKKIRKYPGMKPSSAGNKLVDYRLKVVDFKYSHSAVPVPEKRLSIDDGISNSKTEKSCGWYLIEEVQSINPRIWQSFEDFQTGLKLGPPVGGMFVPNAPWIYVKDKDSVLI